MRSYSMAFVGVLASLTLTQCGKKLDPLTDVQKARFRGTLSDVGTGISSVSPSFKSNPVVARVMGETFGPESTTKSSVQMASRIEQAVRAGDCQLSEQGFSGAGTSTGAIQTGSLGLSGSRCPISLSLTISVSGTQTDGSAEFNLSYQVKDEDYRKLNAVDTLTLSGKVTFSKSESNEKTGFDLNGTIHSVKEQSLTFYLNGDVETDRSSGANGKIAFGIKFPDFTAELKVEADSSGGKCYVNDQEVSRQEFVDYLSLVSKKAQTFGK